MVKTEQIRKAFLDYFAAKGHRIVPSSPLVPGNDPTLLFTNAGMVQFKDVFLGRDPRDYQRAASSQRCVRAGGKHNDLENVGYTARHHTFFEMLGNFSFGDYFKREAIEFAWEFITRELKIPPEKLWVTVFREDDEAADLWVRHIGVDPARLTRCDEKSNFWSMGDTGPCGPCTEIFYDHGPGIPGGPPGSPDEDGDRYVEIWNLVFMQFDRAADGQLTPLPRPSVDTGMGLERIAAVMQGVHSNYDIDLFRNLIRAAIEITGAKDPASPSLRVIADHIRAAAFLITDGVLPGNEGRGYVLRRIIRRALRHGHDLGVRQPFFHRLVGPLEREMGRAFPELTAAVGHVERVLRTEEERFAETLSQGMRILEDALAGVKGGELAGELVFKLYDTYGFPVDLTADVARARGIGVDRDGFEQAMAQQRERARAASKFEMGAGGSLRLAEKSRFTGYDTLRDQGRVTAILRNDGRVMALAAGESAGLVLDRTPFYAESGGQVGDQGIITAPGFRFRVEDTQKNGEAHVHIGTVEAGSIASGAEVTAEVDAAAREATRLNHSATHLLHAALRQVLGRHVSQKGSLVAPDRTRFDFSHYEAVSPAQLREIEALVNAGIRANAEGETRIMSYDDAVASGAMALFGEKYGDRVRVLRFGDLSTELCGGTHVRRTGDIGLFKIVAESGIAAGIRRIEAVTGERALARVVEEEATLARLADLVKGNRADLEPRLRQLLDRNRVLEKEVQQLKARLAGGAGSGGDLASQAVTVAGVRLLAQRLDDGTDAKTLRDVVDRMKDKLGSGVVVLGAADAEGQRVSLAVGVTRDLVGRIKAGDLVNAVAGQVGGKGGGRPDFAQAGGSNAAALDAALAGARDWVASRLG
ncbi:MAG: alanine--tRNA ligase [Gammaproteobacteria bacterium]|nr:MAG: alanine--tRNA ligase [Gammaproteobacteria bacterium]